MLPLLLLAPALAQSATGLPDGLTPEALDDPTPWEERARALLDGPDACVQLQGSMSLAIALFSPGGWLGPGERHDLVAHGTFDGTLDHGTWTRLEATWAEQEDGADELDLDRLHPIVGRLPPEPEEGEGGAASGGSVSISAGGSGGTDVAVAGGSEEGLGLLDDLIAEIDPAVTTAYVTWEEPQRAAVLHQLVPLGRGQGDLVVTVSFPEGRAPTRLDATFPSRVRAGDGAIRVTMKDAQLHLRAKDTPLGLLPGEEGASMVLGALGFTIGLDQRIRYERARACP